MAIYSDIRIALESLIATYASNNSLSVAWPNIPFSPNYPNTFLRAFHMPAETSMVGIEAGGSDDYTGIFQVDVLVARGDGTADTRTHVDGLLALLSRGTIETANAQSVLIEQSWAGPEFQSNELDDHWFVTPISVRYRAFA